MSTREWFDEGCSVLGLCCCELTLKVTVVVTVKLFCGVLGLDHLGGGRGGVLEIVSPLICKGCTLFGSIKLSKFNVLGLVGFGIGVEGSAVLNVVINGLRFNTRSASGLEAAEGGGLYLQNS